LTLWSSKRVMTDASWMALIAGLVTLGLFVLVEHRRRDRAMMPLALFGTKAFVGLTGYTFLLYGALGGLILLLPFVLIMGGYSPVQAGFALLPFSFGIGLGSRAMGRLTERIGPRWPLTIGPLVVAGGFALMLRVDPQARYWTSVLPGIAAIALGMAMAVAPLTTAVLSSVDDEHTGTASGFNSAIARTGGLIATASCGAVIAASGAALIGAFHVAALAGAALAAGAAASAFVSLGD
jgi:predicted MFS family arabinose efflux permease